MAQEEDIRITSSQPLPFSLPREPRQTALVLIDFQGDFLDPTESFLAAIGAAQGTEHTRAALPAASRVLKAARAAGVTVIHTLEAHRQDLADLTPSKFRRSRRDPNVPIIGVPTPSQGRMLVRGSPCNGLNKMVAWQDGEVALHKPGKGAFCDTELRAHLDGVTHLLLCGVTTECCVQTTAREANDRGYNILLITDATASGVPYMKTAALEQMSAFGAIVGCTADSAAVVQALHQLAETRNNGNNIPPVIHNTATTTNTGLPIIDVSPLVQALVAGLEVGAARRAVTAEVLGVAKQLDQACRKTGFFYVQGHGVTGVEWLQVTRSFFALDLSTKLALRAKAGEGAGYEPAGAQTLDEGRLGNGIDGEAMGGDLKESFIIGKSAPSQRVDHNDRIEGQWPDPAVLPGFRDNLIAYHDQVEVFSRILLRGIALGLGLAADTFDAFTMDPMTKLRLLKYPAATSHKNGKTVGYNQAPGCGSHTDWGALTLLAQDDVGGLEVYCESSSGESGTWVPAPNVEGALLINVGDMLRLWTAGRYKSAPHRVLKPLQDEKERYSMAFFYNCDATAPIDPRHLIPNQEVHCDSKVLTSEEYILERVRGTYGQ